MIRNLARAAACAGSFFAATAAQAAEIAIKNGETIELEKLYFVNNCRSLLKSPPTAELLAGPDYVKIKVTPKQVLPRTQQCSKDVAGGTLSITAKDIPAITKGQMIVRVKYDTKDGERTRSYTYDLVMLP